MGLQAWSVAVRFGFWNYGSNPYALVYFSKGETYMKIFGKIIADAEAYNKATETKNTEPEQISAEEWIWIEGYKGTKEDMTCNGYQYELGKRHDMPEDSDIVECSSGFHLCLKLNDVFGYYSIGDNHRFFKVKALVRKSDVEEYGKYPEGVFYVRKRKDKLVSRSIEFVSECTIDEILSGYITEKWTDEDKQRALYVGPHQVDYEIIHRTRVEELVNLGYSEPFSEFISNFDDKYIKACTVASQPGVSMDVKVMTIFCGKD